jgi:hypothetical protein
MNGNVHVNITYIAMDIFESEFEAWLINIQEALVHAYIVHVATQPFRYSVQQ